MLQYIKNEFKTSSEYQLEIGMYYFSEVKLYMLSTPLNYVGSLLLAEFNFKYKVITNKLTTCLKLVFHKSKYSE